MLNYVLWHFARKNMRRIHVYVCMYKWISKDIYDGVQYLFPSKIDFAKLTQTNSCSLCRVSGGLPGAEAAPLRPQGHYGHHQGPQGTVWGGGVGCPPRRVCFALFNQYWHIGKYTTLLTTPPHQGAPKKTPNIITKKIRRHIVSLLSMDNEKLKQIPNGMKSLCEW